MKKNVIVTIKTFFGEEKYFMEIDVEASIHYQVDMTLCKVGYCDAFEVVSYCEVEDSYIEKRNEAIKEFEALFDEPAGDYVTLETLQSDIEWKKNENCKSTKWRGGK